MKKKTVVDSDLPTTANLTARSVDSLKINLLNIAVTAAKAAKDNPSSPAEWILQKLQVVQSVTWLINNLNEMERS